MNRLSMHRTERAAAQAGFVGDVTLRVILLLLVVGQVVFLASRYRTRVDMTSDRLYTLTDSTRRVLDGLEDRLLIEAYFSKESRLPTIYREARRQLENFLDEYVQLSDGKVVIQRLDPQDDTAIREKAERLGMQRAQVTDAGDSAFSVKEIWQGLRLMYGADKQEVIPFFDFKLATAQYEAELTPKIKSITVLDKPVIGLLAFATEAGGGGPMGGASQPKGFNQLREIEGIKGRYEVQNVDLSQGQLIEDNVTTLLLVRPKNLTDRQKYAIDQFVMRGGTLVVFADTNEYEIGQMRMMRGRKINYDATGSELQFLDQLAHYGVRVQDKVVGDALLPAQQSQGGYEQMSIMVQSIFQQRVPRPIPYPYWFHAVHPKQLDYAARAEEFVLNPGSDGDVRDLVERFRTEFQPGIAAEDEISNAMGRGPGMFWPCPVDLVDPLPDGVEGTVLLRSSPVSFIEDPPMDLNPFGYSMGNVRDQMDAATTFAQKINQKVLSEPRQQFGLMVEVAGNFTSFFDGKDIPPRRTEDQAATPAPPGLPNPLNSPIQGLPGGLPGGNGGDGGAAQDPVTPQSPGTGAQNPEPTSQEPAASEEGAGEQATEEGAQDPEPAEGEAQDPETEEGAEVVGPPAPPAPAEAEEEADPDPVLASTQPGRIVVIGDSDFVRDDFLGGEYSQQGGPVSLYGAAFVGNLIDNLAEDKDLLALRNKKGADRTLRFAEASIDGDAFQVREEAEATAERWKWLNVVGPFLAIMALWALMAVRRRAAKQSFLASVQS